MRSGRHCRGECLDGTPGALHDLLYADCDGVVAADSFSMTASELCGWTDGANPRTETRSYPGALDPASQAYQAIYPSPAGCGGTSSYTVTWSVHRSSAARQV